MRTKQKNPTQLTWGLFEVWRPSIIFHDVRIWWHRLKFLLRHGYAEPFRWQYCDCFLTVTKDWAQWMREKRWGDIPFKGIDPDDWTYYNNLFYDNIIQKVEEMEKADGCEGNDGQAAAKQLFADFGRYFFHFWD